MPLHPPIAYVNYRGLPMVMSHSYACVTLDVAFPHLFRVVENHRKIAFRKEGSTGIHTRPWTMKQVR